MAIYRDWEWRVRAALLQHWQKQARKLVARLDEIKAIQDINKDRDWWKEWEQMYFALLMPYIDEAAGVGARDGAALLEATWALGVDADTYNVAAADWARSHAGKLAKGLTKTDQRLLRHHLSSWVEASEDFPDLVQRIDGFLLNRSRAEMIGATEATQAYAEGNLAAWRASDVVTGKVWNTANDELVCPICSALDNQVTELDGDTWRSQRSGGRGVGFSVPAPPAHPRCRCWLSPWVGEL